MSRITSLTLEAPNCRHYESCELPHILLVLDQFPRILGGGERIVLKLAELLPHYGYRASILTFSSHPESAALKIAPLSHLSAALAAHIRLYSAAGRTRPRIVSPSAEHSTRPDFFRKLRSLGGVGNKNNVLRQVNLEPQGYGHSANPQAPPRLSHHG